MPRCISRILVATALLLSLHATASADDAEDCINGEVVACQRLADQGDANAQANLGLMYHEGIGVQQDYAEAVKWWHIAADQGNSRAQLGLGTAYATGQGVPEDHVQAYMWFDLAAAPNEKGAEYRDQVASVMTPSQIEEAQRLAREWTASHQQ